ncbi:MAG: hypothetical protein ACXWBN_20610 [Acidimicrobiales bacterium]
MALPPEPTMSSPFGAAPTPGGPQLGPSGPAANVKRPSAAGYWIAGLIIVVGAVAALIWFVSGISNLFSAVDTYPRFTVPGQITSPLSAVRYKVFAEYPGATTDVNGVFRIGDVTVTDSVGRTIPVSSSYSEETYSWNGHEGRSIAEFTPPTAGNYTIAATLPATRSASTVRVAIGRGLQPSAIVPLFAAAGLGGMAVLIGIVLIVVTAVRRGRAKRRANPAPAFAAHAGYPGGYPGAYPGAHVGAYPPGPPPGAPGPYGQWGPPPSAPWGPPPGQPGQPPAWGAPAPPPPGPPMPPPGGYGAQPHPPPSGPPGPSVPTSAPVSPPVQAPETPPVVPPGWGAAPGAPSPAPAAEPMPSAPDPESPGSAEQPDPDRR